MGFLDRLFSRKRNADRLLRGEIEQARDRQLERAIESYTAVLEMSGVSAPTRASIVQSRSDLRRTQAIYGSPRSPGGSRAHGSRSGQYPLRGEGQTIAAGATLALRELVRTSHGRQAP